MGGVKLPQALAELGLIDEYEFVVHPRVAGHGPTLFAGLSKRVDLKLVSRLEFGSGAVAVFHRNPSSFSAVALCLKSRRFTSLRGGSNRGACEAVILYVC